VNIMDEPGLQRLLADVRSGVCSPDEAVHRLRRLPFADLGFAKVDHHRGLRQGLPEAVYGQGKTPEQCSSIVEELLTGGVSRPGDGPGAAGRSRVSGTEGPHGPDGPPVILTRADAGQVEVVMDRNPGGLLTVTGSATGGDQVRGELATVVWRPATQRPVRTLVVTAGTSDLPVARECEATLTALGLRPNLLPDSVVVVAGMEGALASLIGGITPAPVVAIPTSTGYGAALEGVTALLAMHASCAAGIVVVGIDNGFGAACALARMFP
jgi:hypothetical protein